MNAPHLPPELGLTCLPAVVDDAAELSALFNSTAEADGIPERLSEQTMRHELESYYDPPEERTLVIRDPDKTIVSYATVYSRRADTEELRAYVNVHVAPTWRDRGLEDSITDWAIGAATDTLDEAPVEHRYVCAWLYESQEAASARLAARGFVPARHWWEMERQLNTPIKPQPEDGFTLMPWTDDHSEAARLVHNLAFAHHWGSVSIDEDAWKKQVLDNPAFIRERSFVAFGNGEMVGYATVEEYPEDWEAAGHREAWIWALGVLLEWRKRGIATALLTRAMMAMRDDDIEVAKIGVDSESPSGAQHLYSSVGFVTSATGITWQLELD